MLHELKSIVKRALSHQENGLKSVLATVVYLDGSSYRKPGVRMLISENGEMTGAVSGGCVEKEVRNRAQSVFKDDEAKIITYDGRYRLGCEGILYILIEPFNLSHQLIQKFTNCNDNREGFQIESYYRQEDECIGDFGSVIRFKDSVSIPFSEGFKIPLSDTVKVFKQTMQPCFKLLIIGGEHDAVKLCSMASLLGWEVEIITSLKDPKTLSHFPGAKKVSAQTPEASNLQIDNETAVILMTHNYVQDLKYLLKLEPHKTKYIGILGSVKRREQLQSELMHYVPELSETFLEQIYSPAGLHIGAVTPEEIALSILSEILSVVRKTESLSLRTITGKIHT
jgi:xanthine/CO dehydrogenase XdhC/CoxF family maturation factor